jgi:hypothetical protein
MRQVSMGPLQPENYLGSIPEGKKKFLFESFPNLLIFYWDLFTTKIKSSGYLERRNQGREISWFEGLTINA